MKRKFAIVLLLLSISAVKVFSESGMKIKIDNYEITVPSGWLAQRTDSATVFMLYSPAEENDDFQENGNLTVEKLPTKYSVKGYMDAARESLKTVYGNFTLIEEGKNYHIISENINGTILQQIQFIEMKGNEVYILTFTSTPHNFKRYLETFKSIYKTFKY